MNNEETIERSFAASVESLHGHIGKILGQTDRYLSDFSRNDFLFSVSDAEKKKYKKRFLLFSLDILKFCELSGKDAAELSGLVCEADRICSPELTQKISAVLEAYFAAIPETGKFLRDADGLFADDFENFNHSKLLGFARKFKIAIEALKGAICT